MSTFIKLKYFNRLTIHRIITIILRKAIDLLRDCQIEDLRVHNRNKAFNRQVRLQCRRKWMENCTQKKYSHALAFKLVIII